MNTVLNTPQREQAGSDSYNRFEYQVHWIVFHIVNQLERNPKCKCIIFCEYHDDMAQLKDGKGSPFEFYQIKTKDNNSDWTLSELSAREKKKNGFYKKSFLGFVFYNFLTFGEECSCCHFTSNCSFDKDIRTWQAYIEDENELKTSDPELYAKIKKRIQEEYLENLPSNFDEVFDCFIQKTFIHSSELQLTTYADQVSGHFFNLLETKKIPVDTAHAIFRQILNDVRKKSKNKVEPPISFRSLVDKKGIMLSDISEKLDEKMGDYADFSEYLMEKGLEDFQIIEIIKAKQSHDFRWLKVEDIRYQEIIITIRKEIENILNSAKTMVINLDLIKKQCYQALSEKKLDSVTLDRNLIEVLYYERKYREDKQ